MHDHNLFEDENPQALDALLRDVKAKIQAKQYHITERGIWIGEGVNTHIGGVFDINAARHEKVLEAIQRGDKDLERYWRERAVEASYHTKNGWVEFDKSRDHNTMQLAGLNYLLNALVGSATKKAAWYASAFSSNSDPSGGAWNADWASVPNATEIAAAQTTASARQLCTFGSASSQSIAMSSAATYTVDTGVTGLAVYGATLNSSNVFGYGTAYDGANGHVLLAATLRSSAVTGLEAADQINISYTISATDGG